MPSFMSWTLLSVSLIKEWGISWLIESKRARVRHSVRNQTMVVLAIPLCHFQRNWILGKIPSLIPIKGNMTSNLKIKNLRALCLKNTSFQNIWNLRLSFIIWFPDIKSFINYVENIYMLIYIFSKKSRSLTNFFWQINSYKLPEDMLVNYMVHFSLFGIYRIIYKLFGGVVQAGDRWTPVMLKVWVTTI